LTLHANGHGELPLKTLVFVCNTCVHSVYTCITVCVYTCMYVCMYMYSYNMYVILCVCMCCMYVLYTYVEILRGINFVVLLGVVHYL